MLGVQIDAACNCPSILDLVFVVLSCKDLLRSRKRFGQILSPLKIVATIATILSLIITETDHIPRLTLSQPFISAFHIACRPKVLAALFHKDAIFAVMRFVVYTCVAVILGKREAAVPKNAMLGVQ